MPLLATIRNCLVEDGIVLSAGTNANAVVNFTAGPGTPSDGGAPGNTVPNDFVFTALDNAELSVEYLSNAVKITGLGAAASVSIVGGSWQVNNGAYTTGVGTVKNGDVVRLKRFSSSAYATPATVSLTVGGVTRIWTITTKAQPGTDDVPSAGSFAPVSNAPRSTLIVSEVLRPTGFDKPTTISINGVGTIEYAINGGTWVSTSGPFTPGDAVRMRITSPSLANSARTVGVAIGGVLFSWTVSTGSVAVDDTTPFPINVTVIQNAEPNATYTSELITVYDLGNGVSAPISIVGGEFAVSGSAYGSSPSTVQNLSTIRVRAVAPATFSTTKTVTLTVGTQTTTWAITTREVSTADTFPDDFGVDWVPMVNLAATTEVWRSAGVITGIDAPATVSIVNGEWSTDNGANWSERPGFINAGQVILVRSWAAGTPGATKTIALNIGGRVKTLDLVTQAEGDDSTPLPWYVPHIVNATPNTVLTSFDFTIEGVNRAVNVSIANGEYRFNKGDGFGWSAWTTQVNGLPLGTSLQLRTTSSSVSSESKAVALTIGTVTQNWYVTTSGGGTVDTRPDDYPLANVTGALIASPVTSQLFTVMGVNAATPISVSGGAQYSKNGGVFVTTPGTVITGDTIQFRMISSGSFATTVTGEVNIGGLVKTWTVVTVPAATDAVPDAINFGETIDVNLSTLVQTNAITISGINTAIPLVITVNDKVTNGQFRINGGTFQNIVGMSPSFTVTNNQTIQLQMTSPATELTTAEVTVQLGTLPNVVRSTWRIRTKSTADTVPYPFTIPAKTGVPVSTLTTSDPFAITGITGPTPVSIQSAGASNVAMEINGSGIWIPSGSSGITVNNGDMLRIRVTSAAGGNTTVAPFLIVGGVTGTFSVQTAASSVGTIAMPTFSTGPWRAELPINNANQLSKAEDAITVTSPTLATYDDTSPYIARQGDQTVIFACPTTGARFPGDAYARCDLRERNAGGTADTSWALSTGGRLEFSLKPTQMPTQTKGSFQRVQLAEVMGPDGFAMLRLWYYRWPASQFNTSEKGWLVLTDEKAGAGTAGSEQSFRLKDGFGNEMFTAILGLQLDVVVECNVSGVKVTAVQGGNTYTAFSPKSNWWTGAMMMFFRVGLIGGMGFDGQGLAYEGTGEARAQVSRLVNPVHPYTAVLS